jgi:predicted nucleic acid-binding protein
LSFVLDASATLAFVFPDERDAAAVQVARDLQHSGAIAPPLWPWEIQNAILVAERRKRVTAERAFEILEDIRTLPVAIESGPTFGAEASFARRFNLSIYDAVYLDLAFRRGLPLATRDRALHNAALELGLKTKGLHP